MKQLFTFVLGVWSFCVAAQPVLVNGGPQMAGVDGNQYMKTTTVGSGGYYNCVSASRDGSTFYAVRNEKLFFIKSSDYSITDSISVPLYEIVSSNEYNILFGRSATAVYRINTATKTVMDSIVLPNPWRLRERPGAKELWVSCDSMVYVINYASGLTPSSFKAGTSQYDNGDIRFTLHGSTAYKVCPFTKKIYKINADTKTILDSAAGGGFIEVSADSSRLFMSDGTTIYYFQASNMALTDSIKTTRIVFMMFRHPTRTEIWAVNHFSDSITVFNPNTLAMIDSFDVTGSPHYMAFASGATKVADLTPQYALHIYPNPARSTINVELPVNKSYTISVYNASGVLVKNIAGGKNIIPVDIAGWAAGLYYISAAVEDGQKLTASFMVQ